MSPRGLALLQCIAGIGTLTAMDALVKWLAQSNAVELVALGRYASGTILALAVWQAQRRPRLKGSLGLHVLRGVFVAVCAFSFFTSVHILPLAQTLTIAFVAPLIVPAIARIFLKEALQPRSIVAIGIGFVGVLVAVQGGDEGGDARLLGIATAIFAAVTYAASAVMLRALAGRDSATVITLVASVVPCLLFSPVAFSAKPPDLTSLIGFAGLGILGNIGMQLLARAYTSLESQTSAVMEFTALPWAALLGFFIFGDAVRTQTLIGATIILAAVLLASRPASKVRPADPQSSP
jgi:S-adenosylmethionine uptake transporter